MGGGVRILECSGGGGKGFIVKMEGVRELVGKGFINPKCNTGLGGTVGAKILSRKDWGMDWRGYRRLSATAVAG